MTAAGPVIVHVRARVHLRSDTTLSTGRGTAGAELVRDGSTGRPIWLGTSQAGLLRHHLQAVAGLDVANRLFGTGDRPSTVHTFDAVAHNPEQVTPAIGFRTGNRTDPATATVAPGAVFTDEVLQPPAAFDCEWALHIDSTRADAAHWVAAFAVALTGLTNGSITLGMRSGRGRGSVLADSWTITVHDLRTAHGVRGWFLRDRVDPGRDLTAENSEIRTALDSACAAAPNPARITGVADAFDSIDAADRRNQLTLTMTLASRELLANNASHPATLLHGSPPDPARADLGTAERPLPVQRAPLHRPRSGGDPVSVDSGTALHNWFARHARWILGALAADSTDPDASQTRAEALHAELFGAHGSTARPSRVRVDEPPLVGGTVETLPRVRINPLTLGSVETALFADRVLVGATSTATVRIRCTEDILDVTTGLFALILRDLTDGHAPPLGGGVSVGHGRRILTAATITGPREMFPTWERFRDSTSRVAAVTALIDFIDRGQEIP